MYHEALASGQLCAVEPWLSDRAAMIHEILLKTPLPKLQSQEHDDSRRAQRFFLNQQLV
jgi:hypothetical protein